MHATVDQIAASDDIRIASESARFCTQFIKLGLGGCDIGVSYTLPRIIGAGPAFDMILTARVVDSARNEPAQVVDLAKVGRHPECAALHRVS